MQTCHNEYVKNARLLKIRRFRSVDKTPVTEKHSSQHASSLRAARKELINLVAQSTSCPREIRPDGWSCQDDSFDQLRRSQRGHQIDVLLREIGASVERAFIPEDLWPPCFRQNCHFVSCMKIRQRLSLRARREAHAQAASRWMQRLFKLDAGKLDFVPVTPRQARWLIPQVAEPSQRRLQRDTSLLHQRDHVIRMPRLFRNANAQESKQQPAEKRSGGGKKETPGLYKQDSGQNQYSNRHERSGEENKRRGIPCNCGMQAQHDAAGKSPGDRHSRQPHGTLRNLTRVSI